MPGMVYASIARSPVLGGKLKSYDDQETRKVRGVQKTVELPAFKPPHVFQALGGVAVIADNTWAAMKGREKLKLDWEPGENASYDSTAYKQSLLETVRKPQKVARNVGDVDAEFAKGGKTHEAEYYVPHLAHAPMEPPAAVAEFKDGRVVVHAATQNPQAVQDTVAAALGIDKKNVECHVTLLGGGFGRKSKPDYVAEAALLSKAVGKPVKVTWSREDDIRFDYYHAVAAMYMKAAVDEKGRPTAWLQRSAFPTIGSTFAGPSATSGQGFELGMGWTNVPLRHPESSRRERAGKGSGSHRLAAIGGEHLPRLRGPLVRWTNWRNWPGEIQSNTCSTCWGSRAKLMLGSPAPMAEKFPLETGRLRRVIELAAERSGWAKKKPAKGRGLGIAAHWSFLSYVAAVVEVEVDANGKIRIPRVDIAADVGKVINPDRVKSQFEGASVFGASIALMGEITAANGSIQQSNFHDYPVARINEAPIETRVHLIESDAPPAGVGEPGVPPMLPAICNAVYAATGKRIRDLPLRKHKI